MPRSNPVCCLSACTGPTNYRVTVYTSDMRGAGTDADVYLVIYGDKVRDYRCDRLHLCPFCA